MPVEQGLPWHPVATGLAGQAIPFIVAAPMRTLCHPLHSGSLFPLCWLPLLPCCAPPPCLLCSPLSLLVWLPHSVYLCCSSPCLLALLGAPVAHPLLSHVPAPPYEDFTSPYDVDCPVRGWLVTALLPPLWRAPPNFGLFLFLLARSLLLVCSAGGAACHSLHPIVAAGLSHLQLGGTRGTGHFCTCLQTHKLTCHWCLLRLFWGECGALLLFCFLGC